MSGKTNNDLNVLPKTLNELLGSRPEKEKENNRIMAGLTSDEEMETDGSFQTVRRKRKKMGRQELDNSVEEDLKEALVPGDATIEAILKIENNISKICQGDPSKRVTQKITNDIMTEVEDMAKIVHALVIRNAFLKGMVDGKESEILSLSRRMELLKKESDSAKKATYSRTVEMELMVN